MKAILFSSVVHNSNVNKNAGTRTKGISREAYVNSIYQNAIKQKNTQNRKCIILKVHVVLNKFICYLSNSSIDYCNLNIIWQVIEAIIRQWDSYTDFVVAPIKIPEREIIDVGLLRTIPFALLYIKVIWWAKRPVMVSFYYILFIFESIF